MSSPLSFPSVHSPPSSSVSNRYSQQPPPSSTSSLASPPYSSAHTPSGSTSTLPLPKRDSRPSQPYAPSLQQQLFGASPQVTSSNILDRPLNRTKGAEVALPAFAFLLSEIVSYSQSRVDSVTDLEKRLSSLGYEAGQRIFSLIMLRNVQTAGGKVSPRFFAPLQVCTDN